MTITSTIVQGPAATQGAAAAFATNIRDSMAEVERLHTMAPNLATRIEEAGCLRCSCPSPCPYSLWQSMSVIPNDVVGRAVVEHEQLSDLCLQQWDAFDGGGSSRRSLVGHPLAEGHDDHCGEEFTGLRV